MNDVSSTALLIDDCWNRIGVWRRGKEACPELQRVIHCRNCEQYAAAGRRILEREIAPAYRAQWTRQLAQPKCRQQPDTESIVIFRLGDEWLALPSRVVNEITAAKSIRRLPHRRTPIIRGMVNMRGELQICVSLGAVLGLEKGEQPRRFGSVGIADRMILIEQAGNRYVFPVTEVHGLHRHHPSEIQAAPATLSKSKTTYCKGILSWRDAQVGCLDAELLFYTLNKSLQ